MDLLKIVFNKFRFLHSVFYQITKGFTCEKKTTLFLIEFENTLGYTLTNLDALYPKVEWYKRTPPTLVDLRKAWNT